MRFGIETVAEAEGGVLAHSVRVEGTVFKKGHLLDEPDLMALAVAGIDTVMVARLDPGDVTEDEAARLIGGALRGNNVTAAPAETGRVNLHAAEAGLVRFDPKAVDALNAVTEDVTFATVPAFAPVEAGRLVATVKIIPFGVPDTALQDCLAAAAAARVDLHAFRPLTARLVQTLHSGLKDSVVEKTSFVTAERLARIGCRFVGEGRCPHEIETLTRAIAAQLAAKPDILLVVGASAIVDRRDVIPVAIEQLGGRIVRLGMPVDPGNLILIADICGTPVLGLPGCARSRARNGLDWVLERLSAGLPVGNAEVAAMGVGGLLIGRDWEKDYL
jgi:molybdenum cofactor cytidylyltransferase